MYKNLSLVAPDLRGFNFSDKPTEVSAYNISILVDDIATLISYTGQPVILVGHDWGGIIAWIIASSFPDLVQGLVIINAPHPSVYVDLLHTDPQQQQDSQDIFFFQSPEATSKLEANNFTMLSSYLNGTWFPAVKQNYVTAWSQQSEVNSTLNYYRANFFGSSSLSNISTNFPTPLYVNVSTLVLWGMQDTTLDSEKDLNLMPQYVKNLNIQRFNSSGHYLIHEESEAIADAIYQFSVSQSSQFENQPRKLEGMRLIQEVINKKKLTLID